MDALRVSGHMTVENFLYWENRQLDRHEFLDGRTIAVAEEGPTHATIVSNLRLSLSNCLRGTPCRAFQSGTKLVTDSAVLLPDVMMTYGKEDAGARFVTEPLVVVEVLSEATERNDRIIKNRIYRAISSLRQYVIVSQDRICAESALRTESGWLHDIVTGLDDILSLPAHGLDIPLREIYADTIILMDAHQSFPTQASMDN